MVVAGPASAPAAAAKAKSLAASRSQQSRKGVRGTKDMSRFENTGAIVDSDVVIYAGEVSARFLPHNSFHSAGNAGDSGFYSHGNLCSGFAMKIQWTVAGENAVDSVGLWNTTLEFVDFFLYVFVHDNFNAKIDPYHGHFAMCHVAWLHHISIWKSLDWNDGSFLQIETWSHNHDTFVLGWHFLE